MERISAIPTKTNKQTNKQKPTQASYFLGLDKLILKFIVKTMEDRWAWCATLDGVTKSWTWLNNWTMIKLYMEREKTQDNQRNIEREE